MDKKILAAKVISAFGIKGEVKMISFLQEPLSIEKYPLFDEKNQAVKIKISNKNKAVIGSSASGDDILIVKISGVEDRNQSEALRGKEFFIYRNDLKELNDNEFYYVDLIGLDVVDMQDKKIGKVLNIEEYGAGGIVEIEFEDKRIENFPFKNEIFPEVDLAKGFIRIDLPDMVEIR